MRWLDGVTEAVVSLSSTNMLLVRFPYAGQPLQWHNANAVHLRVLYSLRKLVMLLEWWSGTECTLFSDEATVSKFGKEHVIIILNHNFEIDFLCGWTMTERFGVLGSSKVLAKKELLYVPLIGWTWYFLEIVFCKRKWEEDRDTVIKGLKRLSDYPEYMWFLLYCEGTRFTETKHRISMEVAASKGLPKLKYHLLPRTKGFTTAVQCLRGTEDIPLDEKEAAKWLHTLYQEKEALQIAEERREAKGKGEKERYTQLNAEFQRITRSDKNAFLNAQCKEIEENNRIGRTRDLFKKIGDMKGTFHAKMGMIKDQNGRDLTEAEEIKKRCQDYTEELYKKELNIPDNHKGWSLTLS
ncbi:1-acyl-sn-glycerol-3-phosphate acyltransferase gamma [Varanus komodoensis]|nr:1-acyl-sn-glycerol-3-phosphate acyltransferase gamma [Varanus komodoensis]